MDNQSSPPGDCADVIPNGSSLASYELLRDAEMTHDFDARRFVIHSAFVVALSCTVSAPSALFAQTVRIDRLQCIKQQEDSPDEIVMKIAADGRPVAGPGKKEGVRTGDTWELGIDVPATKEVTVTLIEDDSGLVDSDDNLGTITILVSSGQRNGSLDITGDGAHYRVHWSLILPDPPPEPASEPTPAPISKPIPAPPTEPAPEPSPVLTPDPIPEPPLKEERQGVYECLGIPDSLSTAFVLLTLIVALIPYAAGHDFGVIKIPDMPKRVQRYCKFVGPILLAIALGAFLPIWRC